MRPLVIPLAICSHNIPVVSLRFEKDHFIINKLKTLNSTTWSHSREFW
jgi:hypothetical protein